jgi:hypothetical protein
MAAAKKTSEPSQAEQDVAQAQNVTFEKPASAIKAEEQASKRAEEVAELQKDAFLANHTNVPAGNVVTVYASRDGDKDPESIVFSTDGNAVTVVCSARELVFNGQDVLALARAASQVGNTL